MEILPSASANPPDRIECRDSSGRIVLIDRHAEIALARLRLSAEAAGMGYWDYEEDTDRFWCDENCARLLGGAPADFPDSAAVLGRLHPQDRDERLRRARASFANFGKYASEFRVIHPDGSLHWVSELGRHIGGEDGRSRMFAGVAFDISERKVAELEAAEARRRERDLFEMAPDGIFLADRNGKYLDVNASGCRLLGLSREAIIGRTLPEFIPAEDMERLADTRQRLLAGETHFGEWRLRRQGGCIIPVEVSASLLQDGRCLEFVRDITERKEAERIQAGLVRSLQDSLKEIKVLRGLLPICVHCKKIRDEGGTWQPMEIYIRNRSEASFSHGICPNCMRRHYPGYAKSAGN